MDRRHHRRARHAAAGPQECPRWLGFVLYLVSNSGWITSALHHGAWALLAQQAVFVCISLWGVWVWLVLPMMDELEPKT